MSPIYAVTSWFSLVFHQAEGYLAIIKGKQWNPVAGWVVIYAIAVELMLLVSCRCVRGLYNLPVPQLLHCGKRSIHVFSFDRNGRGSIVLTNLLQSRVCAG
jgi:hypothetical protein